MPPGDRVPNTVSGLDSDEVPLGDIPELDRGELRTDTLEFERVRLRVPKQRRQTRVILSVFVLLVITSGAWAIWGDQLTDPDPNQIPLVKAPDGPFKIKPEMPGGMAIPNRDKLVYGRLEKKTPERIAETLLPQPEQPLPGPKPTPMAAVASGKSPNSSVFSKAEDILQTTKPTQSVGELAAPSSPNPLELEKLNVAKLPKSTPSKTSQRLDKIVVTKELKQANLSAGTEATPNKPKQLSVKLKKAPVLKGPSNAAIATSYQIQLAAVREKSGAQSEWHRLRRRHPGLLGKLNLNVIRADLGSKGVFFRLRAGPISDQASAKKLCQNLSKVKVSCLVVRPGG